MAESETSREDRTEAPSDRRRQQAYEEGTVSVSRDVNATLAFAAGSLALLLSAPAFRDALVRLVKGMAQSLASGRPGDLAPLLVKPAALAVGVCAAAAVAAASAALIQTRGGFWPKLAVPDFKRVFKGGRLRRFFRGEVFTDFGFALVKVVTLSWVVWSVLRDDFLTLPRLLFAGPDAQLAALFAPLAGGLVKVLTALAALAGLDLALTRYRYIQQLKMTKDEVKREMKEDEGDPLVRSRRRRQHREFARNRVAVEVPRADVVLVNPTHLAVALRYRPGEDRAPRVTAKGKGPLAESMRALARAHGIPIVQDVPLARLLYRRVKVGRTVPVETFKAVAAVLAFVYRVLGRVPAQGAAP